MGSLQFTNTADEYRRIRSVTLKGVHEEDNIVVQDCEHILNPVVEYKVLPCCPAAKKIWTGGPLEVVTPNTFNSGMSSGWYPLNGNFKRYFDNGLPATWVNTYPNTADGEPFVSQFWQHMDYHIVGVHPSELMTLEFFRMINHIPWIKVATPLQLNQLNCEIYAYQNKPVWVPGGFYEILTTYPSDVSVYFEDNTGQEYTYSSTPGAAGISQSELGFRWYVRIANCELTITVANTEVVGGGFGSPEPVYRFKVVSNTWYSESEDGSNPLPRQNTPTFGDPDDYPVYTHEADTYFSNRYPSWWDDEGGIPNLPAEFQMGWRGPISPNRPEVVLTKDPGLCFGPDPGWGDKLTMRFT